MQPICICDKGRNTSPFSSPLWDFSEYWTMVGDSFFCLSVSSYIEPYVAGSSHTCTFLKADDRSGPAISTEAGAD